MMNEPVAYGRYIENAKMWLVVELDADMPEGYIPLYTYPVKELTNEDRSMLIRTLKWSEDLLRIAGHDEAVSDVQDCLMILRKAQ
jgi:hypothetical protein